MSAAASADRDARSVLAVAAMPVSPVANGYSLRIVSLLRELSRRHRVTLAAPLGSASPADLEAIGVARVVPMPHFRGWETRFTDDDRRAIRGAIDAILDEERPGAALLWPGTDVVLDNPRLPPRVLDRLDSETLMAWRDFKHVRGPKDKVRALRNAMRWIARERQFVRAAFAVTVDAPVDARVLGLVSGTSNVHVVPSGVVVQPLAPPSEEAGRPTVTLTGSLSYTANVDGARWFVDAVWPAIRARVPEARFVIAGRDPAAAVTALANQPGVEVLGDVPDMWAVLRSSWVGIAPVQTGSGIRTKILEAWAVGRPVVMTPVGSTGLHLDADAKSLVTASAQSTAEIIARLLQIAAERHRLGASAHALVTREHNGWSAAGEQMSALLAGAARA